MHFFNKKLLIFIMRFSYRIQVRSNTVYNKLKPLLQEDSHSFGFKPLSDIEANIIYTLDKIYSTYFFEYNRWETNLPFKDATNIVNNLFLPEYINFEQNTNNKETKDLNEFKQLIFLILDIYELLFYSSLKNGELFKCFIPDIKEENKEFHFEPIEELLKTSISKLEKKTFKKLHEEEDVYEYYGGWFYWFIYENKFGKKELSVSLNENEFFIKNKEDFINLILNLLKEVDIEF